MRTGEGSLEALLRAVRGKLIVSCQASAGEPFDDPASLARFAQAAVAGGAAGIRANGAADVRAIRQAVAVPIIGIDKQIASDGGVLITPTFEGARELAAAGAEVIALDCTARGQRHGAFERLARIRQELGVIVAADIATAEEAAAAVRAGAQLVLSTLRGYTDETAHLREFDPEFIAELVRNVDVPVIAEGHIWTPAQARAALEAGAAAIVVGTAITRPALITRRIAAALEGDAAPRGHVLAVDLGGTNTKCGLVDEAGELSGESVSPTPGGGRDALLGHLQQVVKDGLERARGLGVNVAAIGIATAGWVDLATGSIAYATENLPGWTGAPVRDELERAFWLPVSVENDADVLAHAERHFGAAKGVDDFVCITLGTGVGGGCYANGELIRGAHSFANALGHITIRPGGQPCTCGQAGCLEVYANAAALVRAAGDDALDSAEKVIAAANAGNEAACRAIRECAAALADGCATLVHLLDPGMIILSGGLAQNNPLLLSELERCLGSRVMTWDRRRRLRVAISGLGYYGGVLGAAALALRERRVLGKVV